MKCPECAQPADPRRPTCGSCGVDLLAAFERRAFEEQVAAAARRQAGSARARASRRKRARLNLAGAIAAAVAAVLFGVVAASRVRPPLAPGARRARGCAFEPPPGYRERLPSSGVWTGLARWEDGSASIDVLYAPQGLAERAQSAAGAADVAVSAFNGAQPRVDASRSVTVDGVDGVRLSVSAERAYLPSAEAGRTRGGSQPAPRFESQPLRGELILLPASGSTLIIRGAAAESAAPALRRALDAFCARFRILARPS